MKKICCIGHITQDKIVTPHSETYLPGGTAYYFAHAMASIGALNGFSLVTALAPAEMKAVNDIRARGVNVTVLPSRNTVYFENKYGENQDNRTQRVLAKADPFTAKSLEGIEADIYHLGALLADDFNIEVFEMLASKGSLSVDAQGFLREVRGENVYSKQWDNMQEYLRYVDILKVNEFEVKSLTGFSNPRDAARQLRDWGVKESCITHGSNGSFVATTNKFYAIKAYPVTNVVDATGCGDTYSTGYLYRRAMGDNIADAVKFATALSTIKLEAPGPFNGTESQVFSRIHNAEAAGFTITEESL